MTTRLILSGMAAIALLSIVALAQGLTIQQIVDKNQEAVGGAAAIRNVLTLKMVAKTTVSGQERVMTTWTKRPNLVRTEMVVQGKTIVTAYDGALAWSINPLSGSPEPQRLDDRTTAGLAQTTVETFIGTLAGMRSTGANLEMIGPADVNGSPAYMVRANLKGGAAVVYYLDAGTFMPSKLVSKMIQNGSELTMEGVPGNYKKVGGILFAHSLEQRAGGTIAGKTVFENIEVNAPMDDSLFKMPAKK